MKYPKIEIYSLNDSFVGWSLLHCTYSLHTLVVTRAAHGCARVELHHGKVIFYVVLHHEILTFYCFNVIMYNAKVSGGIITKLHGKQCFL